MNTEASGEARPGHAVPSTPPGRRRGAATSAMSRSRPATPRRSSRSRPRSSRRAATPRQARSRRTLRRRAPPTSSTRCRRRSRVDGTTAAGPRSPRSGRCRRPTTRGQNSTVTLGNSWASATNHTAPSASARGRRIGSARTRPRRVDNTIAQLVLARRPQDLEGGGGERDRDPHGVSNLGIRLPRNETLVGCRLVSDTKRRYSEGSNQGSPLLEQAVGLRRAPRATEVRVHRPG